MNQINETDTLGMLRSRVNFNKPARRCNDCGLVIPSYPGRYPSKCPDCGCQDIRNYDTDKDSRVTTIMKVITGMSNQI